MTTTIATIKKKIEAVQLALNDLTLELERFEMEQPKVAPIPIKPPKTLADFRQMLADTSTGVDLPGAKAMHGEAPKPAAPPKIEVLAEDIVITPEWQAVMDDVKNGSDDLFVTGGAGVGKSTLLAELAKDPGGRHAIVAPTGVAALRCDGMTIHSFFGFKAEALLKDEIRELPDDRKYKFKALHTLFIDEISMVRADLMDAIDVFLRKNGREPDRPFGGTRLVNIGDLFQLPPVSSSKERDVQQWLEHRYGTDTPYFFHADVWRDKAPKIHNLTTIFRQKDAEFAAVLNNIRSGVVGTKDLEIINSRVFRDFKPPADVLWMTLTTTNENADKANRKMLDELPGEGEKFIADVIGDFKIDTAPTDQELTLKVGATVMFVKNDKLYGWVNGTMGKVVSLKPLKVDADKIGVVPVDPATWESIIYEYDPETKKLAKQVKGKFIQVPLRLAAAVTIHKAQGLSLERLIVDLHNGAFAAGQTYVALSRARTLQGLVLRKPVTYRDLITSTEVRNFMAGRPIARPKPEPTQLNLLDQPKGMPDEKAS